MGFYLRNHTYDFGWVPYIRILVPLGIWREASPKLRLQVLKGSEGIYPKPQLRFLVEKPCTVERAVWQAISWMIGAFIPTKQTMEILNAMQYQLVGTMVRIRRRPLETYVSFQIRSRRVARHWLHGRGFQRWSTRQLRLCWRYSGHKGPVQHPLKAPMLLHCSHFSHTGMVAD